MFGLNGPRIVEMGSAIVMPDNKIISLNELHQKNEIISMLKRLGIHKIMMEEPKEFMISLLLNNFPYHDSNRLEEIYDKINEKIRKRFPDIKIRFDRHSIDIYNPNVNKGEARNKSFFRKFCYSWRLNGRFSWIQSNWRSGGLCWICWI